ncbi:DUF2471 family protein [Paraburkholderia humisilvae]|uniref:DUF2471 family protein n=1 Tax=Paraburkholderia humisilvae TaxID=627669 RepID=UPI00360BBE09
MASFERAVGRAIRDLEQIVVVLLEHATRTHAVLTWRTLRAIDEQAFSDLGFQSRHDGPVRATFVRVGEHRLAGIDCHTQVNWCRLDDGLPAVYLIARRFFCRPRS